MERLVDPEVLLRDGYIQEANRQFFHPLGLALVVDDDGERKHLVIEDGREDLEGCVFMDGVMTEEKAGFVEREQKIRRPARKAAAGFWKQPVTKETHEPDRPRRR